jgi:hypothetical protein
MRKLIILMLTLSGCAAQPPYWEKSDQEARAVEITYVANLPWPGVRGYAVKNRDTGVCHIIISEGYRGDRCVLDHELKHCAGWSHPNYRYNLGCI